MELSTEEIEGARRGERAARARLIEVYQARVYAVCRALAGEDAYDCAQDTLVRVLTGLARFDTRDRRPLGAFILRIARNVCIDRARSTRVRARSEASVGPSVGGAVPDRQLMDAERAEQVRACVLALPADQRAAVGLRIWGELDYEQIAEIEDVPIGTIRSRLARARDALRIALGERELSDAG
jgi:RNA polymerase sigma-70 factor (ECF subfamily)